MITLRLSLPAGRPIIRSTRACSRIGPLFGQRAGASVTGFQRRSSGGKLSMNFVRRSTDWPRRSASSAGESAAIHVPIPRSSSASRTIASSTRSVGFASPLHDSSNWMARCATCPLAVAGFHAKSSGRTWNSSQSSAVAILCLETNTSWLGCRRSANSSSAARISSRMSATNSWSNTSGSVERRNASSVLVWTGVRYVPGRDGTDIVELTTIYFADGFEDAALRLAADLDLLPFFVAPIAVMPTVTELPEDVELVVYIGLDRA
jgi:hypothetical protein